ncbi:hypothetical protein B0H10DRAFT_2091424 [Mycena sp. CBHHK59/15]|nr:hypothetical protein B0H10DRAFT_2091424 [Mycena sp. CBHHK59/15]
MCSSADCFLPLYRHSSSSAIFERDIEPLHLSPTAPGTKKDPHRIARSKNTEALEQSCGLHPRLHELVRRRGFRCRHRPAPPSSAGLLDQSTIRSRSSGFASPIGSFRSRSPSPSPRAGNRTSLLLNIPPPGALGAQHQHVATPIPQFPSPPASSLPNSGNLTARQFEPPTPTSSMGDSAYNTGTARASKRLSFLSYADLLSSTPTSTQPLSALTSPACSPSHIPGVAISDGAGSAYGGSGAPSLRNFGFGPGEEDRTMDDVGGEWEREGLGKGLEERLEALQGLGMT